MKLAADFCRSAWQPRKGPSARIVAAEAVDDGAFVLAGRDGASPREPICGNALHADNAKLVRAIIAAFFKRVGGLSAKAVVDCVCIAIAIVTTCLTDAERLWLITDKWTGWAQYMVIFRDR